MSYGVYLSSIAEYSDPALLAAFAREAEQSGWDGAFLWDHVGQTDAARRVLSGGRRYLVAGRRIPGTLRIPAGYA